MTDFVKQLSKANHRYLVFTSAGKNHNIHAWLTPDQDFDLWVSYYDDDEPRELIAVSDYFHYRKGSKYQNLFYACMNYRNILERYDAIYVTDDDILIKPTGIHQLFNAVYKYDIWVVQPAFDPRGKVSHKLTLPSLWHKIRYTSFIENTCPVFRTNKLLGFMGIYDESLTGYGIDFLFCHFIEQFNEPNKIAVLDEVICLNPHDVTKSDGREILRLQSNQQRLAAWKAVKERLNIPDNRMQVYAAEKHFSVTHIGRVVSMYLLLLCRKAESFAKSLFQ